MEYTTIPVVLLKSPLLCLTCVCVCVRLTNKTQKFLQFSNDKGFYEVARYTNNMLIQKD